MHDSDDRFFRGNIASPRSNGSSSNFRKGRKKQDGANGVCNNKMSFVVKHHKRKDWNEKPRSWPTSDPMSLEKTWGRDNAKEAFTIRHKHPDQYVTMGTTLTTNYKQLLADVLRENREVFVWTRSERTTVQRFVMEHQLRIYPLAKPVVHKRRPMSSEGRLALKEKVIADQRGRNVETYLEEIVIKSKSEMDLVQDVKETLRKLKRVNIKIDPTMSLFGVKEGRFLSYMVAEEGLRADPGIIQAIILSPTPRSPNQIRSLFLTAISKSISKLAELKHPIHETRTRMEKAKESGWTNEAEEALRRIKRKLSKKEAEGPVVKKFFGQKEQVEETPDANKEGIFDLSKGFQENSTPTTRAWRLYLGRETIKEGSGIGIILVEGNHTPTTEQERRYKEEIMNATVPFHRFRITHLPKILNLKAEVLTGLATIKQEFVNQETSLGIKTRPSVEETSSSKKGKATSKALGAKPNYNHEASGSNSMGL
ncbi:hypothetical protein Tco_0024040 [Tanacetum coccineum]